MKKFVYIKKCPLCKSEHFKIKFICRDNLISGENFKIYSCAQCGFSFTNYFPSADDIHIYYDAPEYISHTDTNKGFINKLYHCARFYMIKRKLRLVCKESGLQKGNILDIGCGTGYFLNAAKSKGWNTLGIEKCEQTRKTATEHFGLDVKSEEYMQLLENSKFDVITLWHVLEHIENLNESMDSIYRILRDNGVAFIAVPNCASYDASHYKNAWAAYDVPRHLWHFTPKTFEYFANKHNFTVTKTKIMFFDAFYISALSEKYKKRNNLSILINSFVIGIIGFCKSIFNKEKSSSIIYVLRKKRRVTA